MRQRAMAAKVGMWFVRASTRPIRRMLQVAVGPKAWPGVSTQRALWLKPDESERTSMPTDRIFALRHMGQAAWMLQVRMLTSR
jgi:hypothetical protein